MEENTPSTPEFQAGNLWKTPGFPHRGWVCIRVVDLNPDESPADEADYETCQVCNHHPIRFVHTIAHAGWPDRLDVGRICAEHLTQDYVNPRKNEDRLRKISGARSRWLKRRWRISAKGAFWLKVRGHHITVFLCQCGCEQWRCCFDGEFGTLRHPTTAAAMMSAFNKLVHVEAKEAMERAGLS